MSKTLKTMIMIATLVATLLAVNTAFAQDDAPPAPVYPYGSHMGGSYGSGGGWMSSYNTDLHAEIAEMLGLTVTEFEAEMFENGKTMWQLAAEYGVDYTAVQQAMQAARTEAYAQAAADGVVTQQRAGGMRSRLNDGTAGLNGTCAETGTCNLVGANSFSRSGGMGSGRGGRR